ncbi:ubiquitin-like protein 4A isoform X2 [Acipenser ruthenus]|nr:ubiquitin-like protein 4A isoform X2 [Acipenser ruthenus]
MRRSPQSGVWSLTGSTYLSINRDSSTKARRWQVCEDEKVSTVWSLVSDRLNIPVNQQGLLYKGKALAGRLNSTAQHRTAHPSSHASPHPGSVWHSLPALLNKHFSPADAVRVWSSNTR